MGASIKRIIQGRLPVLLIIILAAGILMRVLAALYMGNYVEELPGTADQISYNLLASRVLHGYGFTFDTMWWPVTRAGEPTAHWSYLYTYYLVAVYSVFGENPLAARIIQAILVGLLQPYLVYRIGHILFGRNAALIATALTSFYLYFIYYSGALMTEPFYITLILAAVVLSIEVTSPSLSARQKFGRSALLGLALGGIVLLRQLFMLMIPFFLIWIGWRERKNWRTHLLAELVIPMIIVGLMILPFTIFNYQRFHEFVLLNTNAGYAFFWGNHPIHATQFIPILPASMGTYQDLIPRELWSLNEAALDKALMKLAVQNILADPLRFVLLSISRIPPYFQFWYSPDSGLLSNVSRILSFGILWPFMLYGLIRWGMRKGFQKFSSPGWLILMFSVIYTGIHLLSWTLVRYRLPIDAMLLLFAGYAILDLAKLLKSRPVFHLRSVKP